MCACLCCQFTFALMTNLCLSEIVRGCSTCIDRLGVGPKPSVLGGGSLRGDLDLLSVWVSQVAPCRCAAAHGPRDPGAYPLFRFDQNLLYAVLFLGMRFRFGVCFWHMKLCLAFLSPSSFCPFVVPVWALWASPRGGSSFVIFQVL